MTDILIRFIKLHLTVTVFGSIIDFSIRDLKFTRNLPRNDISF